MMPLNSNEASAMSRRSVLALLSSAGLGTMISQPAALDPQTVSPDPLMAIAEMLGLELTDEELQALSVTVPRVLAQFQRVRDLEIEDRVEPSLLFRIGDR